VCTQGAVRLIGGTQSYYGRVEICHNEDWGTVCDDSWNLPNARVVCRQLGYTDLTQARTVPNTQVPDGTGQIWLDEVRCTGSETTLAGCPANPFGMHNCVHSEDAGVSCEQRKCILVYVVLHECF